MLQPSEKIARILRGEKKGPSPIQSLLVGTKENPVTETVDKPKKKLKKKAQDRSWLSLRHYAMDIIDKGLAKDTHPMIRSSMYSRFLNR